MYFCLCNHGTQGGLGFAFPEGFYKGTHYQRTFLGAYNIHKMLDALDDFPGLKVSLELDSYAYEAVAAEDPACIARLRSYLETGRIAIVGGTYGQPLGQDYGWEPNVRQLLLGRSTAADVLGVNVEVFLVEEQWFHPQLPQLLRQAGFSYASLQAQNSGQVQPMRETLIHWQGADGTTIPTIPANDLIVSCVRQYTDYTAFAQRLAAYERPLLFQWVEIWPPGMDWGASVEPFAKGIQQIQEWQAEMVHLHEFCQLELQRGANVKTVSIPLDQSNYINNWYQAGGWGYDGDRVIVWDKLAEQSLLAWESAAAAALLQGWQAEASQSQPLIQAWKELAVLQNHDFSVARNYRAITEEGLVTEAGSLAVARYRALTKRWCRNVQDLLGEPGDASWHLYNDTGFAGPQSRTLRLPALAKDKEWQLFGAAGALPVQEIRRTNDEIVVRTVVDLPAWGTASVSGTPGERLAAPRTQPVPEAAPMLEDERARIRWVPGTWSVEILWKATGEICQFTGFTGPIAKQNEHDGTFYPALSSAHEKFSFAFDGTDHCPDQVTDVNAWVEACGGVESTLLLHSDLLTLHTTDTPAAFAQVRIRLNHVTGEIQCEPYLYAGVYLGLNCYSELSHSLADAEYTRDYPFGEEQAAVEWVYPLSYVRASSGSGGWTLVHPGTQRAQLKPVPGGGVVRHLMARDRVFGSYRWTYRLVFGAHTGWESLAWARAPLGEGSQSVLGARDLGELLKLSDPRLVVSGAYEAWDAAGSVDLRLVNFSEEVLSAVTMEVAAAAGEAALVELDGRVLRSLPVNREASGSSTLVLTDVEPWSILTVRLTPCTGNM